MNFTTIMLDISLFCGLYFQIFLLVTFFDGEKKEEKMPSLPPPTVSIIVPCFNEARTVEKTIRSLLGLDYPKDKLSILVVDDGSTDDTYAVAKNLAGRLIAENTFKNIRVVRQENAGKFSAMNYGIEQSTADLVGCLDADSTVDSQALIRMIPYFSDKKVMAVTPAMRAIADASRNKPTILQHIQQAEYNIGIFTKRIYGLMNAIHVTPGPFSIFRRSIFKEIGYFRHAHNTEDMEIAFRIQSHGYRIANCHNAFVYTITPDTLNKLYRQRTRWTVGFIANLIDYRRILFNKKYGNMGMLTLPCAVIGIFFVFYFFGLAIYHTGTFMYNTYERIATVGLVSPRFSAAGFFHSIYFNFGTSEVLSLILLATSVYIIFKSKKMAEGSMKPSRDIFYFLFLYSFLAPIWIGKSVYNVVFSKKTPWR